MEVVRAGFGEKVIQKPGRLGGRTEQHPPSLNHLQLSLLHRGKKMGMLCRVAVVHEHLVGRCCESCRCLSLKMPLASIFVMDLVGGEEETGLGSTPPGHRGGGKDRSALRGDNAPEILDSIRDVEHGQRKTQDSSASGK